MRFNGRRPARLQALITRRERYRLVGRRAGRHRLRGWFRWQDGEPCSHLGASRAR